MQPSVVCPGLYDKGIKILKYIFLIISGASGDVKTDAEDSGSDLYCPQVAYDFAWWVLIILWIMAPFIFCCGCIGMCCAMMAKKNSNSNTENA